jgi:ribosomal protein S18 acetylase RimI-like enzyme
MHNEHYQQVVELWEACGVKIEKEDSFENIHRFIVGPQSKGYVATVDRCLVGATLCSTDLRYGYIHHLAVREAYRKIGIGKNLVEKCKEFIFSFSGVTAIAVFVWEKNQAGQDFWQSIEFERIEELKILTHSNK